MIFLSDGSNFRFECGTNKKSSSGFLRFARIASLYRVLNNEIKL
jgi:hypothetical protein